MPEFVRVASKSEIPEGEGRAFDIAGRDVAVFRSEGEFYAIENVCKHQANPLVDGELVDCIVTCPFHDWTYDIRTGESPDDPDCAVECFAVKVDGEDVLVESRG